MNIYLISQTANDGYDTYDAAVVLAPNKEYARRMYPNSANGKVYPNGWSTPANDWVIDPSLVTVRFIGKTAARRPRVILASFNAG